MVDLVVTEATEVLFSVFSNPIHLFVDDFTERVALAKAGEDTVAFILSVLTV
jgi:hypothetical protein